MFAMRRTSAPFSAQRADPGIISIRGTSVVPFSQPLSSWLRRPQAKEGNQRLVGPHHRLSAVLGTRTSATTNPPFPKAQPLCRSPLPAFAYLSVENSRLACASFQVETVCRRFLQLKWLIFRVIATRFPLQMFLLASRSSVQSPALVASYASRGGIILPRSDSAWVPNSQEDGI